jgi:tyrosine-protein kinase Etk/Wzc
VVDNDIVAQSREAGDEITLVDLILAIAQDIRLIVSGSLGVGVIVLALSFLITPVFTARTSMLPPQQQQSAAALALQSLGSVGGLASVAAGIKNPADQYVTLLGSRTILDRLVDRFDLMKVYECEYRFRCREELEGNTRISISKDGMISVEVEDESPKRASELANAYTEELQLLMSRLALTEAQQRRQFFEKQLGDAKDAMTHAQQELQSSGVAVSSLKMQPQAAITEVAALRARITANEVKLQTIRNYFTDGAPDAVQTLTELSALRQQLAKAEASVSPTTKDDDYVSKYREFKYQETLFELFSRQFELAKLDESREGAVVQVIDTAVPPEMKTKPRKALLAVGATLAAGFVLTLFVLARFAVRIAATDPQTARKLQRLSIAVQFWRTSQPG